MLASLPAYLFFFFVNLCKRYVGDARLLTRVNSREFDKYEKKKKKLPPRQFKYLYAFYFFCSVFFSALERFFLLNKKKKKFFFIEGISASPVRYLAPFIYIYNIIVAERKENLHAKHCWFPLFIFFFLTFAVFCIFFFIFIIREFLNKYLIFFFVK